MPEFELLRSEISLESVKTISCACVCRVTPEQEETGEERGGDPQATPNPLDPASDMMCLRSSTGMKQDSACFEPASPVRLSSPSPIQSTLPIVLSDLAVWAGPEERNGPDIQVL